MTRATSDRPRYEHSRLRAPSRVSPVRSRISGARPSGSESRDLGDSLAMRARIPRRRHESETAQASDDSFARDRADGGMVFHAERTNPGGNTGSLVGAARRAGTGRRDRRPRSDARRLSNLRRRGSRSRDGSSPRLVAEHAMRGRGRPTQSWWNSLLTMRHAPASSTRWKRSTKSMPAKPRSRSVTLAVRPSTTTSTISAS